MNLWRTISSLAAARGGKTPCPVCPEGLPGEDPKFSAAVTALGAKLARADGRADQGEFEAFSEVFQPGPAAARDVQRLYDLARQTTRGFESYARQIARRYRACPGLLEDVLDGLFHIAKADGRVTEDELAYLAAVAAAFGLTPEAFERIRAAEVTDAGLDPYAVLGVPPDGDSGMVRRAYLDLVRRHHPDRLAGEGLPHEFVQQASARLAAVNAAYVQIVRARGQAI